MALSILAQSPITSASVPNNVRMSSSILILPPSFLSGTPECEGKSHHRKVESASQQSPQRHSPYRTTKTDSAILHRPQHSSSKTNTPADQLTSPPRRILPSPRSRLANRQHKSQPPPLRLLPGLTVEIRHIIRIRRFRRTDPLPPEIREIRNLIREHLIHALLGQDLIPSRRTSAPVEQRGEDAHVVGRPAETARAGGVVDAGDFCGGGDQGPAVEVVARSDVAAGRLLVQVGELGFGLRGGEHGRVVEAERGEDVGLEVFVQRGARCALDECAGPVDPDLVGG